MIAARDGRRYSPSPRARAIVVALVLVVATAALAGLGGNLAIARSNRAADAGDWSRSAAEARTASRFAPWAAEPWRLLGEAELVRRRDAAARTSFGKAIAKDPENWLLWFDLAAASRGRMRDHATAEAKRLNPLAPELAELGNAGT